MVGRKMSYVTSLMIVNYYNDKGFKRIIDMLSELSDDPTLKPQKANLNEQGNKYSQFGDIYFFAFNYLRLEEFKEWLKEKKIIRNGVQIFLQEENDDYINEMT